MSAQLELDLSREPAPARRAGRAGWREILGAALRWTPVWVPLAFLAQLVCVGLLPARAEERRLERAEGEVRARAAALEAEERELADEARMLSDDVYRERVRKSLVDPGKPPLTLQRARTGSGP